MSQGQEYDDIEKLDPEKDLDQIEHESTANDSLAIAYPSKAHIALDKEPDIETTAASPRNTQSVLDAPVRGRSVDSRYSHSSNETHQTESDTHGGHDHQLPPHRDRSRAQSSTRSARREAEKVPRHERRGLFGRFTVIAEVTDPYAYPRRTKWMLTFVIAVAGAAAPMGSSIILPALHDIAHTFNSTPTVVNLSVAFYMLSMSIFPLWWSSFSETLGRRTIYLTSFMLYVLFNILSAVSTSIGMFIAMRALSGGAAASVQAVGAGTIADIWEVKERGAAMGIFYLGPLCGPLISPIIGGVMTSSLGWRSVQWFMVVFGAIVLLFLLFWLPETLRQRTRVAAIAEEEAATRVGVSTIDENEKDGATGPIRPTISRTTTKQSVQLKTRKYLVLLRRCFIDPLRIILYAQFPAVAICVAYSSITFASLYILNISVQSTFAAPPYRYNSTIIGLLYLPNSVGYFVSSIFGGRWVDRIMHREARKAGRYDDKGRLQFRPEDRMKENAWIGAFVYPLALMTYGWTAQFGVSIAAPMVANFFFGLGSMLIFAIATTMLTEFMPRKASNGVALNNFVRNIFSCIGTIVAEPLIMAIGNGWLFTGLCVIAIVGGSLTIWAMKRYGDRWRVSMDKNLAKVMGD